MKQLLLFLLILVPIFVFSQSFKPVLIIIESPDYNFLSKTQQLKVYFYDDAYLLAEIDVNDLELLERGRIPYQIVDDQGWSGAYFIVTERPFRPFLTKIQDSEVLYKKNNSAIVKIDPAKEPEIYSTGLKLQKITPLPKPFPGISDYQITCSVVEDSIIRNIIDRVSAGLLEAGVQRLQEFKTRHTFSDSIVPAAQWIYDQYRSYGYFDVQFDTFYINSKPHRNVIATKPGLVYPDSVIMIGGHYDSIVFGPGTNYLVYAPGADDNASGVIAGVEAARILADYEFEATIKFVAWDAEEIGLVGSEAYAQKAYTNQDPVSLYINLDMIANLDLKDPIRNVTLYTDIPTMPFAELIADMANKFTTLVPFIPGNSGGSDHRSFQIWGYHALYAQEGDFSPHWHKISDVTDNMNFNYMKEVVQMNLAAIIHLAGLIDDFYGKPYVKYKTYTLNDDMIGASYGNGNGFIDAGETIELFLTVQNYGQSTAEDVTAVLTSQDSLVTITKDTQTFGTISPQTDVTNLNGFIVQFSPVLTSGHKTPISIHTIDRDRNSWNDRFYLKVMMPELVYHQTEITEITGNGNDAIDPGETINLTVVLENKGLRGANNITSTLRCHHPDVAILDSEAVIEDIPLNGLGRNSSDPLSVKISNTAQANIIPFSLKIHEHGGFYKTEVKFNLAILQSKILLVEDDGRFELSHYYRSTLDLLGIPYFHWDTDIRGQLIVDTLMKYDRVIWYTGMESRNSLFKSGTKILEQYLEQGGKLFANGSLFAFSIRDSLLLFQYLSAKYVSFKTNLHHLTSRGANSVFTDCNFWLATAGENSQSLTGEIDAIGVAQPILFYDQSTAEGTGNIKSSGAAAIAVANKNYRAILLSSGWEGIADESTRQNVLINILDWLQSDVIHVNHQFIAHTIPAVVDLLQNYPNPFNPITTIRFQLPAANHVTIKIFNSMGQEIKTLVDSEIQAGQHRVEWNGRDNRDHLVSSGIYLYRMTTGNFQKTGKMVLLY